MGVCAKPSMGVWMFSNFLGGLGGRDILPCHFLLAVH